MRRAGSGLLPGGRRLTWTVADGRRGRRWRAITTSADGRLAESLLLETAPDGTFRRLELATPAGLLTLHPDEAGEALHGNVVRPAGVEHVALPWSPGHAVLAGGSAVTGAVAALALSASVGVGEGRAVRAVEVGDGLAIRRATWRAARVGDRRWRLLAADGGAAVAVELDGDGIPSGLGEELGWPLESG